jgi:hypothetical protein
LILCCVRNILSLQQLSCVTLATAVLGWSSTLQSSRPHPGNSSFFSATAPSPSLPAVTRLLRRTAMGALFSRDPPHQGNAATPHRVTMPRRQENHDLKRSRHDELTETQQKDAQVKLSLSGSLVRRAVVGTRARRHAAAGAQSHAMLCYVLPCSLTALAAGSKVWCSHCRSCSK